jgi:dienelactone hydrolase
MIRIALLAFLLLAVATACGGGGDSEEAARDSGPFAYDHGVPLAPQERSAEPREGIDVREISFAGGRGTRVRGMLALPKEKGRHPAVIYLHGDFGGREDFLDEAVRLAEAGAVALTLDTPYSRDRRPELQQGVAGLRGYADVFADSVVETRRAVDLLESREDVDPDRIGLVGWSAGARTGAILAGVERRIDAFDFFGGGASPVEDYAAASPPELRAEVRSALGRVDPLRYVRDAAPARLLFQNGRRDEIVPREALMALYNGASRPKTLRWYDGGHTPTPSALAASRQWLAGQLGLARTEEPK